MWIVETGTAYLGTKAFVVEYTRKFRLKKNATKYFEKWFKTHCKGGTGFWSGMPVPSAKMYERKKR